MTRSGAGGSCARWRRRASLPILGHYDRRAMLQGRASKRLRAQDVGQGWRIEGRATLSTSRCRPAMRGAEAFRRTGRQHQWQADRLVARLDSRRRDSLDDHMGIGAAEAEAAESGAQHLAVPRLARGHRPQWPCREIDQRIVPVEIERRHQRPLAHHQKHFDDTGEARRCFEMADGRLHRADAALVRARPGPEQRRAERRDLDRIAQRRAGAVRLDIGNRVEPDAGRRGRRLDDTALRGDAGRGDAGRRAVHGWSPCPARGHGCARLGRGHRPRGTAAAS